MITYISGPMSGLPEFNYPAFHQAAARLRKQGRHVVNPAEFELDTTKDWTYYMRKDLAELTKCDAIYLLKDWNKSRGATLELFIATQLGLVIEYE